MATQTLFTLPILSTPTANPGAGHFVCTSLSPGVYLLTFTSPPDNRLVTSFCQSFLLALDILEFEYPPGVVITTSGITKFFSNGLDLEHATQTKGFWSSSLFTLFKRLLTYICTQVLEARHMLTKYRYPMPTVALVNGHAFAGGCMLAMYHDYRIFNPTRGFLCLNELDLGVPLKPAMSSIFRQKITAQHVYRSLVLEAKRFGGKEALEAGLVDGLGGLDEALAFVGERKLADKAKTGVYGVLKAEMYRETVRYLEHHDENEKRDEELRKKDDKRVAEGKSRVKEWSRNAKHAKL